MSASVFIASNNRARKNALAVATAIALSSSLLAIPAFAGKVDSSGLSSGETHDRFIIGYVAGSTERTDARQAKAKLNRTTTVGGKALSISHQRRLSVGADVIKAGRRLDRIEAEMLMRELAVDPNVAYVEVDQLMKPVFSPNDTYYASEQWHYYNATAGIKANEAWDVTNGAGTVVAVIDTGITDHTDLNANILPGYDFISETFVSRDGDGRDSNPNDEGDWNPVAGECYKGSPVSDSSWHGTHVAGTVAAVTNNATGVAGVAYGAKIVPARVLGRCGGYTSDIVDAITWTSGGAVSGVPANANPAEVINMSLGGPGTCSATYQAAINGAVGRGTTVVIAAGNDNVDVSGAAPANCPNVIAVASTTITGQRSSFSNYGTGIDIAAPGSDIMSTLNAGTTTPGAQAYASYNGTSMAAPHVAGVVALVQAAATTPKTPAQIEALLKSTVRAFPVTPTQTIGPGILNAKAAVDAANAPPPVTQTYTNSADVSIPDNNATGITSSVEVSGRTGNAPSTTQVTVNIAHTYIGNLIVDLIAPDGSVYNLHNRTGGSADNLNTTYTVDLATEALNGTWKLRAKDRARKDTGYIDSWSITF